MLIFQLAAGLSLLMYGMSTMSDGIQQAAGSGLQKVLRFMTGHRLSAVLTGFALTAIIQSSSAATVMVVSFVNAGLLSLTQAIGVIMGANIGTTVTAWIVALIGFKLSAPIIALPCIALGFLGRTVKWKFQEFGNVLFGFGILFLGLDFLTRSAPNVTAEQLSFLTHFQSTDLRGLLLCVLAGLVVTLLIHSSSASTAIMLAMAYAGLIDFRMAAAMVLGANIGTTIDALLASIGTKTAARQAAFVHLLFNVFGCTWAFILFNPLIRLVDFVTPGDINAHVTEHVAMFHTMFNLLNTIVLFPFINKVAYIIPFIIKDKPEKDDGRVVPAVYKLDHVQGSMRNTPELSIFRAEKEIRDMAELVRSMYSAFSSVLQSLTEESVDKLVKEQTDRDDYASQMREALNVYLLECMRHKINRRSEYNVTFLLRIVADLKDMTYYCLGVSYLLQRSVKKDQTFKHKEMEGLIPYMKQVGEFLEFVGSHLGGKLGEGEAAYAEELETRIDGSRDALRKLGRKQIEAGENVKTELLFIDLVRRLERLGDYCYSISESLAHMI
jgi:phosphate:Na+ symporter